MPKANLTDEQQIFIINNRLSMSSGDLAIKFGYSDGVIRRFLKSKGLSLTREQWQKIRSDKQCKTTSSDVTTDYLLREFYLFTPVKTMADIIGRSGTFVDTRLRQLNLVQPRTLINKFIHEFRRKPGDIPANKGKKQTEYMSAEAIEKTKATRFRKGNFPHSAIGFKDGDISIRFDKLKDGSLRPYKWIRICMGEWKMLHVVNWEKEHGPVPDGMIIIFKDYDSLNCDPENLECISMAENMKRNSSSLNLTDGYIAFCICGKNNMHLYEEVLKDKSLLEAKRQQLLLRKKIKTICRHRKLM
jgi:hypothetical protein